MADRFAVVDIEAALEEKRHPTVTLWNRLEGRPRTVDFERALRAEVRDALWMLTRQWQAGEFRGEDAGSPVFARLHVATTRLTRFRPGIADPQDFDEAMPLETQVERQPLCFTIGRDKVALDLRLTFGRRWLKQLAPIGDYAGLFVARYAFDVPDPGRRDDAAICADAEVWQGWAAVAARAMDGVLLYQYLTGGPDRHAYDGLAVLDTDKPAIDAAATTFVEWVQRLFAHPGTPSNPAWQPSRLEYSFSCSAPSAQGDTVYSADEYYGGTLDWHSLDVGESMPPAPADVSNARAAWTRTMIPVPLAYAGMPHPRWWTIEDGRTNFGEIRPDTTDLAKLLFIEFGLVYSNDWFSVPVTLPGGSIASVQGLAVSNVFGERFWIEAAGQGPDDAWQRWRVFALDVEGTASKSTEAAVVLLPIVPKVQEGAPLEEVLFIRDEMANLVWGVERTIPAPDGRGRSGITAGRQTRAYHERLVASGSPAPLPMLIANEAAIRYDLMSAVPEHWIPFIAVHVAGGQRAIRLQRASVPRLIERDPLTPPALVKPRTTLLRSGLDAAEPASYFVFDEEVPRSGARVTQAFHRARWLDGRVFVWLGVRKRAGRGEGSSGLAYDRIVDKEPGPSTEQ
ncbi:MAG: hypothetical protein U0Q12_10145 [Vicinamibacterales bacterium]